jgi:hypothetical protein
MRATDLLRSHHREIMALLDRLRGPIGTSEAQRVVHEFAAVFGAHCQIEQEQFYPMCAAALDDRSALRGSYREHAEAADLVRELLATASDDPRFGGLVERARLEIEAHANQEELGLFRVVEPILGDKRLEVLGASLEVMFDDAVTSGPEVTLADGAIDEHDVDRALAMYEPRGERVAPMNVGLDRVRRDVPSAVHHAAAHVDRQKAPHEGRRHPNSGAEGARKTRQGDHGIHARRT